MARNGLKFLEQKGKSLTRSCWEIMMRYRYQELVLKKPVKVEGKAIELPTREITKEDKI